MSAIAFDTLKLARRLETAGFSRDQASGAAEALAETFSSEIATKSDLNEVKLELKADIAGLRAELKSEIANVKSEFAAVRSEFATVRSEFATVRSEIATVRSSVAQWMISAAFFNALLIAGGIAAVWRLARP